MSLVVSHPQGNRRQGTGVQTSPSSSEQAPRFVDCATTMAVSRRPVQSLRVKAQAKWLDGGQDGLKAA